MAHDKCDFYFSFSANFCSFTLLTVRKIKILKNEKKHPEISSFKTCTRNYDQIMYGSWVMVHEGWTDKWKKWHIRAASNFCNENSRTIQEHFKNISILFKNTSDVENIITIDLKVFLKKLNLIITKDKYKYQQEQNYKSLSIIK